MIRICGIFPGRRILIRILIRAENEVFNGGTDPGQLVDGFGASQILGEEVDVNGVGVENVALTGAFELFIRLLRRQVNIKDRTRKRLP